MNTPVRAVVFDLNGVLTRPPTPASLRRLRAAAALDEDVLLDRYWRNRPEYDRGAVDSAAYWELVGGRPYADSELVRLVAADAATWGRANRAVVDLLVALAASGTRVAILSNTPNDVWRVQEERHAWLSAVHVRTLSFAGGSLKPEQSIFRRCLSDLGAAPAETFFVDDRAENVETARALGLRACLYRTPGRLVQALRQTGLHARP